MDNSTENKNESTTKSSSKKPGPKVKVSRYIKLDIY